MLQSQQIPIRNSIKNQIRQRRKQLDEDNNHNTSFRSYRKKQDNHHEHNINDDNNKSKELSVFNHQTQDIKLIRQYPSYSANLQHRNHQQQPSLKFKYSLQNNQKQNNQSSQHKPYDSIRQNSSGQSYVNKLDERALTSKFMNTFDRKFQLANKSNRSQVKSIIFDSKVQHFEPYQSKILQSSEFSKVFKDSQIQMFQQKVNKVNFEIQSGLSHLEALIQAAKKKKIAKSIQIHKEKDFYSKLNTYKTERQKIMNQIAQKHQNIKKQSVVRSVIRDSKPNYIKQDLNQIKQYHNRQQLLIKQDKIQEKSIYQSHLKDSSSQINTQNKSKQELTQQQQKDLLGKILQQESNLQAIIHNAIPTNIVQNNQSTLMIKLDQNHKTAQFPPQYTSFINRLVTQIQLDIQFTTMISDLSKNNHLTEIKNLIFSELQRYQNDIQVIQSFFLIQSSQIDPLQEKKPYFTMKYRQQQGKEQALKIYKKYRQIQKYFTTKLQHKYDISIIKILLEQLSQFNFTKNDLQDKNNVTIGHLLSYLNMKTNKSFRNRYFVKMMKRLNLRSNQNLSIQSLKIFIDQ